MFVTRCDPERSRISRGRRPSRGPGRPAPAGSAATTSLKLVPLPGVVLRGRLISGEQGIEPLEDVVVEPQRHRALGVIELSYSARPDDRPGDTLLVQQPGQRHVGRLLAEFVAQVLVGLD